MRNTSVVTEANEIHIAVELINLGARLQVLQEETKSVANACSSSTKK